MATNGQIGIVLRKGIRYEMEKLGLKQDMIKVTGTIKVLVLV
jgi:hypothetical protein